MRPQEVFNALTKFIVHWEKILDGERTLLSLEHDSLCVMFPGVTPRQDFATSRCTNQEGTRCPVYQHTGKCLCVNTPWSPLQNHLAAKHNTWKVIQTDLCQTCRELVQKEIDFLRTVKLDYAKNHAGDVT